MRTHFLKTLVLFVAAVTFLSSCNKSNSDNEDQDAGSGTFSCDINGVPYTATEVTDNVTTKFSVSIQGKNLNEKKIVNILFDRAKAVVGTTITFGFLMGVPNTEAIVINKLDANGDFLFDQRVEMTDGTFTFTKVSKTEVEGTFTGSISSSSGTTNITNGRFSKVFTSVFD